MLLFSSCAFKTSNRSYRHRPTWRSNGLILAVLFIWIIGQAGFALISTIARIPIFDTELNYARIELARSMAGFGYVNLLLLHNKLFIIFASYYLFTFKNKSIKVPIVFGLVLATLELAAMGNRGALIFPYFTSIIIYHYVKNKRLSAIYAFIFCIIFLVIIGFLGYLRSSYGYGITFPKVFSIIIKELAIVPSNFSYILDFFPRQHNYFFGTGVITPLITLLPGKQYLLDVLLKKLLGFNFAGGGLPATILGSFYVDFGFIGIAFGMLCLGGILQFLYVRMVTVQDTQKLLMYAVVMEISCSSIRNMLAFEPFYIYEIMLILILDKLLAYRMRIPANPDTHSSPFRTPIPIESGHLFQTKADTHSRAKRTPPNRSEATLENL